MEPTKRQIEATREFKIKLAKIMAASGRPDAEKWRKAADTLTKAKRA